MPQVGEAGCRGWLMLLGRCHLELLSLWLVGLCELLLLLLVVVTAGNILGRLLPIRKLLSGWGLLSVRELLRAAGMPSGRHSDGVSCSRGGCESSVTPAWSAPRDNLLHVGRDSSATVSTKPAFSADELVDLVVHCIPSLGWSGTATSSQFRLQGPLLPCPIQPREGI